MRPVLIDTDIGGDIDDAIALAVALRSPELRMVAITTVYMGNVWRVGIVRRMLEAFGREDVPVYPGAEQPLLGRWGDGDGERLPNESVAQIIRAARENPGLTLVCIGPLTNIALALREAPDMAAHVKIALMGGMTGCAHPEWNIACDPEAARIVFESGADVTMFGLDVTEQCRITRDEARAWVAGDTPAQRFLQGELQKFFELFDFPPTLHDPLVVASLLWDDLLTYAMHDVRIETRGEFTRGVTAVQRHSDTKRIRVATAVDAEAILRQIALRVTAERPEGLA